MNPKQVTSLPMSRVGTITSDFGDHEAATSTFGASVISPELYAVSLCSVPEIAAALRVGKTKAYDLLNEPGAPKPAIRSPRFTRYRTAAVADWISRMGSGQAFADDQAAPTTVTSAHAASDAAKVIRNEGGAL